MRSRVFVLAAGLALALWAAGGEAQADPFRLAMDSDGGGGTYINVIVREVRVAPIRAHIGDVVRVDMTIEDQGDLVNATRDVWVRANGKIVSRMLMTFGFDGEGGRIKKATLVWNTAGEAPGEYRIRGEAFVWGDASPFDNWIDVPDPVVLLRPGDPFAGGARGGGESVAVDSRYGKPAGR